MIETITLDLVPHGIAPSLHASQFDKNRSYRINLTQRGDAYKLDGTETLSIIERKGDDRLCSMDIENNFADKTYIEFSSTEQMCAVWGANLCQLKISKGGVVLGLLNFILEVQRAPDIGGVSCNEYKNLERQVHDIVVEELADNGAEETGYDNTESGLDATNVQDALDELAQKPSVDAYTKQESDEKYATKTELSAKADVSAIPTKTSDLQNDSGFAQIDDSEASASKTYSSEKIEGMFEGEALSLNVFNKDSNIGVGQNVIKNTTGANNSALGGSALQNVTTGGYNTGVGRSAGDTITTGSNNTIIGYNADVNANNNAAATAVGKTAIAGEHSVSVGANTSATGSYSVAVGDSSQATTNNSLALGRKAKANFVGSVAIGTDDQGNGAEATKDKQIVIGTTRQTLTIPAKVENLKLTSPAPNPTTDSELAPAISTWTPSGATWVSSYWNMGEGNTISTTFTAEADADYLITLTVSNAVTPNAEVKPLTITLDSDSISIFGANDANWVVALKSSTNGSVTITIGGATWSGRISNVSIKKIANYFTPDLTIENRNLHAYGTNVVFGSGQTKMAIALSGNTAVGYNSQDALNTGKGNTAVGIKTQKSLTNGSHNTAVGENVQEELTTGMYNTAMGFHTQEHLISGCWNVSVGNENLKDTTTGCNNTTMGRRALNSLIDGHKNTVMGAQAGFVRDGVWDAIASIHSNEQAFFGFQATQYGTGQQDKACAFGSHACSNENGLALGSYTQAQGNGSVAIGMDSNGNSAVATTDDDFVLGTTAHRFIFGDKVIKFNNDNTVTWETLT